VRRFLTRLACYLALLAGLQQLVGPWAYPPIARQLDDLLALRPSLLFLGDSSVFRADDRDVDRRSTAQMLGDRRGVAMGVLQGAAQSADLWAGEVRELLRRGARFDTVVAVINMRSFSPSWDLEPGYQFTAERTFLSWPPYLRPFLRPLVVFSAIDLQPVPAASLADAPVYDGTTLVGRGRDFLTPADTAAERERKTLLLFYMASLRTDHRKLRSLVALADSLREARTRLVLYVSPIDVEKGASAFGPLFRRRIEENVGTLERELAARGADVVDLCCFLPDSAFSYSQYPNEHLKAAGRMAVADALAVRLDRP
jgi:hypothetical protein